jgi:hypothetical protein
MTSRFRVQYFDDQCSIIFDRGRLQDTAPTAIGPLGEGTFHPFAIDGVKERMGTTDN